VARPERAAEVPGIETAVVTTAPVRDLVRAFGTVGAEGEPAEVRDARTALAEAEARRALAAQQVRRLEPLAGGVAPRKELDAARAEEASAAAAADRARAVLAAYGRDAGQAALGPGERWVIARVMQLDVPRVAAGSEASFAPDALPGERFAGSVGAGVAYVDPATQTAPVPLRVSDPGGLLRPGMTGAVALEVGARREAVVVPSSAVVYDDAQPLVFVAEDGRYAQRPVRLGIAREGRVEVIDGLAAGAQVVVTGAASLLSQARLPAGGEEGG
jgi:hypothetical protein